MSIASELQNYADGLDDAWDAAEDMGATIPTDRNMNNLDDAIRTIPVSSPNDGTLTIQQNGATVATFTADQATNTTANITTMTGATSSVAGAAGLVPAPTAGDQDKYLKGDGTWATVQAGATVTTFYRGSTWASIYKDSGLTTAATGQDILDALANGPVNVAVTESGVNSTYSIVEYMTYTNDVEADFALIASSAPRMITLIAPDVSQTSFMGDTTRFQEQLTAGSNITISGSTISATDTTYSDFTGATSSTAGAHGLVPAPSAGDQDKVLKGDGTWGNATAELVEMNYGESNAWAKFIAAYRAKSIVYCRASSSANPASGSQTRKAFMAYVNNADNPTSVEFQYVRSVGTKTVDQPVDQVFVYTLTNANGGTWTVTTRNMAPKIAAGTGISVSYSNGTYTISLAS